MSLPARKLRVLWEPGLSTGVPLNQQIPDSHVAAFCEVAEDLTLTRVGAYMYSSENFPGAKRYCYNGRFYDWSEGFVHPMVHALHYGTSVFEGLRAYSTEAGPAVFRLDDHIDRLMVSAAAAKMQPTWSKDEIVELIKKTIEENDVDSCYIRPLLFYSYGNLGMIPRTCPVELVIGVWAMAPFPPERREAGLKVCIVPQRRVHHTQFNMAAKLGGVYIQSMIAGVDARRAGYDEAVFLNMEGRVSEGPGANILVVKDGVVTTNSRTESILEGITRTSLLEIAGDLGYATIVAPITKQALLDADEAFFCGTAFEVVPIVSVVDGSAGRLQSPAHRIGKGLPGPVTAQLMKAYQDAVTGRSAQYMKWLTYVSEVAAGR